MAFGGASSGFALHLVHDWCSASFPPKLPLPQLVPGPCSQFFSGVIQQVGRLGVHGRFAWVQMAGDKPIDIRFVCWGSFGRLLERVAVSDRVLILGGKCVAGSPKYNPGTIEWECTSSYESTIVPWPVVPPAPSLPCSIVDLFSGVGGVHTAAHTLGVPVRLAIDVDARVCHLYKQQWPDTDVRCADIDDRSWYRDVCNMVKDGDARILCATPPCPAISNMVRTGIRKRGFDDKRAWLTPATLDLASIGQFPAGLIEQVYGLLDSSNGHDLKKIRQAAAIRGYCSCVVLCNGIRFVPQTRKRICILLVRADLFSVGSHICFAQFLLRAWTVPSPCLRWWGIPLAHEPESDRS